MTYHYGITHRGSSSYLLRSENLKVLQVEIKRLDRHDITRLITAEKADAYRADGLPVLDLDARCYVA